MATPRFGGTGEFKHVHALVAVSPIDPPPYYFAWDGAYSFNLPK